MRTPAAVGRDPVVAVICRAPFVADALRSAFEGPAFVQELPPGRGTAGLLGSVEPDAVVVDSEAEADAATAFSAATHAPLVHVSVAERRLRVWGDSAWREESRAAASPEAIRNIVIGGIYKRRRME